MQHQRMREGQPENRSCQIFSEFGFSESKNLFLLWHVLSFLKVMAWPFDHVALYHYYITTGLARKYLINAGLAKKEPKGSFDGVISIHSLRVKRNMHVIIVVGRNATTVGHQTPLTGSAVIGVKRCPKSLLPNNIRYV